MKIGLPDCFVVTTGYRCGTVADFHCIPHERLKNLIRLWKYVQLLFFSLGCTVDDCCTCYSLPMPYFVYFLQCADQSLYCGYTKDLSRRIKEHNDSKKGAKYTRAKRPVVLVYSEEYATLSEALRREYQLKQLSNQAKKALIRSKEHV